MVNAKGHCPQLVTPLAFSSVSGRLWVVYAFLLISLFLHFIYYL